jgi:ABC-type transport system involved in multi-copper enzyme maturation permease subunit
MLWEFFAFELRSRLRQPTVWLFTAVFALLAFGATTSDAIVIGGAAGSTAIDAPIVVTRMLSVLSVIGIIVVTAFVATSVIRDFEQRTYAPFFTSPIRKRDFLLGRFFGSLAMAWIVFVGAALGMIIGAQMPWLDPERLVGTGLGAYAWSLGVLVFPNLTVMGAVFFAVGTLTRRVLFAYVAVAGFFVIYVVSQNLVSGLDNDVLAAMADPFGLTAIAVDTRYWTVAELNVRLPQTGSLLAANRLLWLGIGALALGLTHTRFRMAVPNESGRDRRILDAADAPAVDVALPRVSIAHGSSVAFTQLRHQIRVELSGVLRSTAFLVICLFAALNAFGGLIASIDEMYGTPVYPVTSLMLRILEGSTGLFVLIVIVFYSGELVWKERKVGLAEVYDALPVPSWVPVIAKLVALWGAIAGLLTVTVLTAIGVQLWRGWTDIDPLLYFQGIYLFQLSGWMLVATLAIVLQAIANHKYVGFLLMAGYFVVSEVLPLVDLERDLYNFGAAPRAPYSDMNGYGHFATAVAWYRLYWALGATVLVILAVLLWPRGTDQRMRLRLSRARRSLVGKLRIALVVVAAAFCAVGGWIFYNTDVLNHFVPSDEGERLRVLYEQRYKQYEHLPQPRVVAVDVDVELYPADRRADLSGTITLENRTDAPIDTVHVALEPNLEVRGLTLPGSTVTHHDEEVGYRILTITPPLAPGDRLELGFDVGFAEPGFVEQDSSTAIVYNGSFLHSTSFIPRIGYDPGGEIGDPNERRKRGLPERQRMADLDDPSARANTYISREGDWIAFAATVGTSLDQVALAPGYLQREWTEGDRRYFRYVMDAPILDFYAFLSGRWNVERDQWRDVAIEVYHHPAHDMNVARMIEATKKSLDYFTANFSPYQHRQVRIVEFPGYASFAQSFPNTIPYSESIGFIADLRDPDDIDYVFYVTAHEVAHQWWAHQVIGADAQGSTIMSETLAQYSALMVMEKAYGREHMRKFLAFELDRYLSGRGRETHRELPLIRVENQPYVHYNKGSLVMYALREYIGEATVNRVLAQYIEDVGFQGPPYTTARDLVERLRAATPADRQYLIEDLFETITLYDNRAHSAKATQRADGKWDVEIEVETHKLRATDDGSESEVPLDDLIEVGVFVEREIDGRMREVAAALEHHRFSDERSTITLVSTERPVRAGIDPRVLLVDRNPDDNVRDVSF